jgi:hypothetical protein
MNLDRILTAVLLFKGLLIEWVVIRGYKEKTGKKSPDLWTESNYQVRMKFSLRFDDKKSFQFSMHD